MADAIDEIERALDEATDAERASLLGMLRGKMKRALPAVTTLVEVAPRLVAQTPRPDWRALASSVMGGLARRVRAALA